MTQVLVQAGRRQRQVILENNVGAGQTATWEAEGGISFYKKLFLSSWWELHGTIKYDSRWVWSCDTLIWGNGTSEQVRKYLGSWAFFLVKSMSLQRFLFDRNTWGLNEFLSNLFKTKRVFCLHTFDNPRPNLLMTWNNGLEIPVLQ